MRQYKDGKYIVIELTNGNKFWYFNDKRHREDGPAVEKANGNKFWYLRGKEYTEEEFLRKTGNKNVKKTFKPLVVTRNFNNAINQLEV